MADKEEYKALELSGTELDSFIKNLVNRLYSQIWSDLAIGPDEILIKERLKKSVIEALKEYAEYKSDER